MPFHGSGFDRPEAAAVSSAIERTNRVQPPRPAHHQVSPARWIDARKLPNRRRIVFSDGRLAASVQLSAVGSEQCSATSSRMAATDSSIRVSARSDSCGPPRRIRRGGFVLWQLMSTKLPD